MSELVTGIGGFFFRAKDPAAMADWYATHLGIAKTPTSEGDMPWMQAAGPTVFAPFCADTDYFGEAQQAMINLRVTDLDAIVASLAAAGIVAGRFETIEGVGRFARIHDPEGNAIELWEPAAS